MSKGAYHRRKTELTRDETRERERAEGRLTANHREIIDACEARLGVNSKRANQMRQSWQNLADYQAERREMHRKRQRQEEASLRESVMRDEERRRKEEELGRLARAARIARQQGLISERAAHQSGRWRTDEDDEINNGDEW